MPGACLRDPARRTRWTPRCCGAWGARTSSSRRCWRGRREAGTSAGGPPDWDSTHTTPPTQHNNNLHFNFILLFPTRVAMHCVVRARVCVCKPPTTAIMSLCALSASVENICITISITSHRIAFASSQHVPNLFHLQQSSPDPAARPERRAGEVERRDHAAAAGAGAGAGRPHSDGYSEGYRGGGGG